MGLAQRPRKLYPPSPHSASGSSSHMWSQEQVSFFSSLLSCLISTQISFKLRKLPRKRDDGGGG